MRFFGLALAALLLAAITASGAAAQGPVLSYTGCFDPDRHDKQISELAVGDEPARPCGRHDELIHLSGGDLTGMTAGAGLEGGGDNGELLLSLAPGYRLPQGCTGGNVPGWSGSAWACLDPATQAEFDAYKALLAAAGTINDPQNPVQWTKLKGVPAVFADGSDDAGGPAGGDLVGSYPDPQLAPGVVGTAELAAGAVTNPKLADSAVTTAKLADSAVTSAKIFDSTILLTDLAFDPATQAELDALAQPGTINTPSNPVEWTKLKNVPEGLADGIDNVNERPEVPAPNVITTLDSARSLHLSATTGADGLGLISYVVPSPVYDLKVAHCSNVACTQATTATIDSAGEVHESVSLTIGADGLGLMSYRGQGGLRVAHCSNVVCSSATVATIVQSSVYRSSITIGADGLGLISYQGGNSGAGGYLKVAHCVNVACTAATIATIDDQHADVADFSSITLGADGLGLISYTWSDYPSTSNHRLNVAHCENVACTAATIATIDGIQSHGDYNSIAIGADGLGLISYQGGPGSGVRVAHCESIACSTATIVFVGSSVYWGQTTTTIGADGLGLISYRGPPITVAHCSDLLCSTTTKTTLDADGAGATSATIGADGRALIAYPDPGNPIWAPKVVHCANAFCVPNFRRR